MACFYPIDAWKSESGPISFSEKAERKGATPIKIPCGQCIGCRLERSRQWAIRCLHESAMHDSSRFVTLTYNAENLPKDGNLHYPDFQKFMKRLRKAHGKVRFYMCGEYGEQFSRPHFHACLFGLSLPDEQLFRRLPSGFNLYTSASLERLWPHGFVSIGDVSFESAAYVARYVMKKVTGKSADAHYRRIDTATGEVTSIVPEFTQMSLKPGIGASWIRKFRTDVYNEDGVILRGGIKMKPPKYYDKFMREFDDAEMAYLDAQRYRTSLRHADENTKERLAVREEVTRASLAFKKRNAEFD